jgi:hypothetical protein
MPVKEMFVLIIAGIFSIISEAKANEFAAPLKKVHFYHIVVGFAPPLRRGGCTGKERERR